MDGRVGVLADELISQWVVIQKLEGAEKLVALYEWEDRVWLYMLDRDGSDGG